MADGDEQPLLNDSGVLVAASIAALFVAGSAYLWRAILSHPTRVATHSHRSETFIPNNSTTSTTIPLHDEKALFSPSRVLRLPHGHSHPNDADAKELKSPRSKERRRRGKDPLKELLKGGKKSKGQSRLSKLDDILDDNPSSSISRIQVSTQASLDFPSSRSVSSTSSTRNPYSHEYPDRIRESDGDRYPSASSSSSDTAFSSVTAFTNNASELQLHLPTEARLVAARPLSSAGASDPIPSAISHASPTLSRLDSSPTPTLIQTSSSATAASTSTSEPSIPNSPSNAIPTSNPELFQAQMHPLRDLKQSSGPWDWEGAVNSPTSPEITPQQKPPRFQAKARTSSPAAFQAAADPQATPSTSTSAPNVPSDNHPASAGIPKDDILPGSKSSPSALGVNGRTKPSDVPASSTSSRRTPRRTPTPSSGIITPPPSLSMQTQIASLRGALEAARLREEKVKGDIERYFKELEMVRWENAHWRRREIELQSHIHHLTHQLQAYTALYASLSNTSSQATNPSNGINGTASAPPSTGSQQNGYGSTPQQHLRLQLLPNASTPTSAPTSALSNGVLSPMPIPTQSPLPFFNYPSPHLHHPHPPLHQNPAFNMIYPFSPTSSTSSINASAPTSSAAVPATGSDPPSVAESSSTGSLSPDLSMSGSPRIGSGALGLDRGRRRTRGSSNSPLGGVIPAPMPTPWEQGDGWAAVSSEFDFGAGFGYGYGYARGEGSWVEGEVEGDRDQDEGYEDEDDGEEGLSVDEALADAILKRPGSIGVRGRKKRAGLDMGRNHEREEEEGEEEKEVQTEFVFPSLSELGNVKRKVNGEATGEGGAGESHHVQAREAESRPLSLSD